MALSIRVHRSHRFLGAHSRGVGLRAASTAVTLLCFAGFSGPVAAMSSASPGSAVQASQWPQYGYGPARVWFNPRETVLGSGNIARLAPRFDVALPSEVTGDALGGGLRYVCTEGLLRAVNASTGALVWQVNSPSWAGCNLTYDGGKLLVFWNAELVACKASTGGVQWATSFGSANTESVAVRNGLVYVERQSETNPDWWTNYLDAFDEATGAHRWSSSWQAGDEAGFALAVTATALVTDGAPAAKPHTHVQLVVRNPLTGTITWTKSIPVAGTAEFGWTIAALSIQGNIAYATVYGHGSALVAVDLGSRSVRFQLSDGGTLGTAAFAYGRMYISDWGAVPKVIAVDASTGQSEWRVTYSTSATPDHVVVANGVVYELFQSTGSTLMAWQADTGDQLLALSLPSVGNGFFVAAGRVNFVGGADIWSFGV